MLPTKLATCLTPARSSTSYFESPQTIGSKCTAPIPTPLLTLKEVSHATFSGQYDRVCRGLLQIRRELSCEDEVLRYLVQHSAFVPLNLPVGPMTLGNPNQK